MLNASGVKYIGIVLVVLTSLMVGLSLVHRLKHRVSLLQSISDTLTAVRREISYGMPPLTEILNICACGELSQFTHTLADMLNNGESIEFAVECAAAQTEPLRILTRAEYEMICTVFAKLGTTDAATQLDIIDGALCRVGEFIASAKQRCAANSKVYLTLSLYVGLTAAILLI